MTPDLAALAAHVWQSTLVTAAAAVLVMTLRSNRADVRYRVWFAASIKFLIPFAALAAIGERLGWRAALPAGSDMGAALDFVARPLLLTDAARPAIASESSSAFAPLAPWLLAVWACGTAVSFAVWGVRWMALRSHLAGCRPAEAGREREILDRVRRDVGVARPVTLVFSATALEPCVYGIARPVLLWPASLGSRLTDAQIAAIVAHELAHVRRRDNLTAAAHTLVQTLFWWHPAVRWLGGRLVAERELACDADVIHRGGDRRAYAESILTTCALAVESRPLWAAGVAGSHLARRIEVIMNALPDRPLARSKKLFLGACGVLVVTVPIAVGVANAPPPRAQTESAPATGPAFAWASIVPNRSGHPAPEGLGFPRGGGFFADNVTVRDLIRAVYGHEFLGAGRIVGGPDWIDADRFDVRAQADGDPLPHERALMVRTLLADRFGVRLHTEPREVVGYSLTGSGYAPGVTASLGGCPEWGDPPPPPPPPGATIKLCGLSGARDRLSAEGATMWQLALVLERHMGRTVVDRTGLSGRFDFTLDWSDRVRPAADLTGQTENRRAAIATALQEQLGLAVVPQTVTVEVLVVDAAAPPTLR